ncbi:MAG: exodeoxyribonuclease III [Syntrophomonadaceae bacterium]|jgi:exodeoxyribonuclease-3
MKIYSWNVNGIRSVFNKGFMEWMQTEEPDILCLQETKAGPEQLHRDLLEVPGYQSYWNIGAKKGYSGVATYVREMPVDCSISTGIDILDGEGRLIITRHAAFTLLNVYFPNGQMNNERLQYKLQFYEALMNYCEDLKKEQPALIICGDFNTAHRAIDLKNPKNNEKRSGFLPVEREVLDRFLNLGYVDVFRLLYPEKVQYSWWDYRTRARERNAGWRIDYFYASEPLLPLIDDCTILDQVAGSDHCPISLHLK